MLQLLLQLQHFESQAGWLAGRSSPPRQSCAAFGVLGAWSFGVCCQRHKMLDIKGKSSGNCDCGKIFSLFFTVFPHFFRFCRGETVADAGAPDADADGARAGLGFCAASEMNTL